MKRLIMFGLIGIIFTPTLAQAYCDHIRSWGDHEACVRAEQEEADERERQREEDRRRAARERERERKRERQRETFGPGGGYR